MFHRFPLSLLACSYWPYLRERGTWNERAKEWLNQLLLQVVKGLAIIFEVTMELRGGGRTLAALALMMDIVQENPEAIRTMERLIITHLQSYKTQVFWADRPANSTFLTQSRCIVLAGLYKTVSSVFQHQGHGIIPVNYIDAILDYVLVKYNFASSISTSSTPPQVVDIVTPITLAKELIALYEALEFPLSLRVTDYCLKLCWTYGNLTQAALALTRPAGRQAQGQLAVCSQVGDVVNALIRSMITFSQRYSEAWQTTAERAVALAAAAGSTIASTFAETGCYSPGTPSLINGLLTWDAGAPEGKRLGQPMAQAFLGRLLDNITTGHTAQNYPTVTFDQLGALSRDLSHPVLIAQFEATLSAQFNVPNSSLTRALTTENILKLRTSPSLGRTFALTSLRRSLQLDRTVTTRTAELISLWYSSFPTEQPINSEEFVAMAAVSATTEYLQPLATLLTELAELVSSNIINPLNAPDVLVRILTLALSPSCVPYVAAPYGGQRSFASAERRFSWWWNSVTALEVLTRPLITLISLFSAQSLSRLVVDISNQETVFSNSREDTPRVLPVVYVVCMEACADAIVTMKQSRLGQRPADAIAANLLDAVPTFLPTTSPSASVAAVAVPAIQTTGCLGVAFAGRVARHVHRWLDSSGTCDLPLGLIALAAAWRRFETHCGDSRSRTAAGRLLQPTSSAQALEAAVGDLEAQFSTRVIGISSGGIALRQLRALREPAVLQRFVTVLRTWDVPGVDQFVVAEPRRPGAAGNRTAASAGASPAAFIPSPVFEDKIRAAESALYAVMELYSVARFLGRLNLAPPPVLNELVGIPAAIPAAAAAAENNTLTELNGTLQRFYAAFTEMNPRAVVALRVFTHSGGTPATSCSTRFCSRFSEEVARQRRSGVLGDNAAIVPRDALARVQGIALQEADRLRVRLF